MFDKQTAEDMYTRVYKQLKLTIDRCTPTKTKVVIVIGGQPGAGKSSITQLLEDKFDRNIVSLNGDDYKTYYPNYREILRQDPDKAAEIVQPYSNYVVDKLQQVVIEKNLNVIVEGTMRNANTPLKTATEYSACKYNVEAHVLSVNYYLSRASCIERFEYDIATNGVGRSVNVASHNEAYKNIPATIQALVDAKLFHDIAIRKRSGDIIATLKHDDNVVNKYVQHRKELTFELIQNIKVSIENSVRMKQARNAPPTELNELQQLSDDFNIAVMNYKHVNYNSRAKLSDK